MRWHRSDPVTLYTDHEMFLVILYRFMDFIKNAILIAIVIYIVSLEVSSTRTNNYESSRKLGVSKSNECYQSTRLYNCNENIITINGTNPNLLLNQTPICYYTSLDSSIENESENDYDKYHMCIDDTKLKAVDTSIGNVYNSYNDPKLPTTIKCLYSSTYIYPNVTTVGNGLKLATNQSLLNGLTITTINDIFPYNFFSSRRFINYYPFNTIIIILCCLSIVLGVNSL